MLLFIVLAALIIIFCICLIVSMNRNDDILVASSLLGLGFSGFILLCAGIVLFFMVIGEPSETARLVREYKGVVQEVETMNAFNEDEVREKVNKWNDKLYLLKREQASPWLSVFKQVDTKEVNFIKLD